MALHKNNGENNPKDLALSQRDSKSLAFLALFLLIGLATTVTFATNVRAMLLLPHSFQTGTVWAADFSRITGLMIARAVFPINEDFSSFHNMDFFKLTARYVRSNNNVALWLALIEVALVNFFSLLRRIPKLRMAANLYFGLIALGSPIIFLISSSYAGF
ncbi:MAG: hypothetical protein KTR27_04975 [Leptolyngbyaceae cyanobacterium MAG.088]|nr:hypothetical protein [Leptolyngbyaceae cyanobacterium MAG.088]